MLPSDILGKPVPSRNELTCVEALGTVSSVGIEGGISRARKAGVGMLKEAAEGGASGRWGR